MVFARICRDESVLVRMPAIVRAEICLITQFSLFLSTFPPVTLRACVRACVCVCVRACVGERERETERDRHRKRDADSETETDRQIYTETDRQT